MRTFARLLMVISAVLGLSFALTSSAAAQGTDGPTICLPVGSDNDLASCVWFKAYGNIIYVEDNYKDGYSAVAQVSAPGISENLWNTSGGIDHKAYVDDIAEGSTVTYRACRGILSTHSISLCTSWWAHGTA